MPSIVERLRNEPSVIAAELRPPRAELETRASMDAWIDTYHAVRSLTREGTPVFLTDSAVGLKEEDNLRHLVNNLGSSVPRSEIVPFLTCKHPMEFCTAYADRAIQQGFLALVVLGGDKSVGPPRCVAHAWELREEIRRHQPKLALGGWANPHADVEDQVGHLLDEHATAEFYLTQIVSHHSAGPVRQFVETAPPQTGHSWHVRGLLLSLGQPADAGGAQELPARAGQRADRRVRRRGFTRRDLRADDSRTPPPARAISTSATCRCSARR